MNISKAEYFAAHAPGVPEWFNPDIRKKPTIRPLPIFYFNTEMEREYIRWHDDDNGGWFPENNVPDVFKQKVDTYIIDRNKEWEDQQAWEQEARIQTIIQWPVYYGNLMAAAFGEAKRPTMLDLKGIDAVAVMTSSDRTLAEDASHKLALKFNNGRAVILPIGPAHSKEILSYITRSEPIPMDRMVSIQIPLLGDNKYFLK